MEEKEIKEKLEKEKQKLEDIMKDLGTPPDFNEEPGEDEDTDEAEEFYNQQSSAKAIKRRISDIESAIIRLENGKYGVCEKCGAKISEEMLNTIPETRLCKDCKMTGSDMV